jgi:hypothetical protein
MDDQYVVQVKCASGGMLDAVIKLDNTIPYSVGLGSRPVTESGVRERLYVLDLIYQSMATDRNLEQDDWDSAAGIAGLSLVAGDDLRKISAVFASFMHFKDQVKERTEDAIHVAKCQFYEAQSEKRGISNDSLWEDDSDSDYDTQVSVFDYEDDDSEPWDDDWVIPQSHQSPHCELRSRESIPESIFIVLGEDCYNVVTSGEVVSCDTREDVLRMFPFTYCYNTNIYGTIMDVFPEYIHLPLVGRSKEETDAEFIKQTLATPLADKGRKEWNDVDCVGRNGKAIYNPETGDYYDVFINRSKIWGKATSEPVLITDNEKQGNWTISTSEWKTFERKIPGKGLPLLRNGRGLNMRGLVFNTEEDVLRVRQARLRDLYSGRIAVLGKKISQSKGENKGDPDLDEADSCPGLIPERGKLVLMTKLISSIADENGSLMSDVLMSIINANACPPSLLGQYPWVPSIDDGRTMAITSFEKGLLSAIGTHYDHSQTIWQNLAIIDNMGIINKVSSAAFSLIGFNEELDVLDSDFYNQTFPIHRSVLSEIEYACSRVRLTSSVVELSEAREKAVHSLLKSYGGVWQRPPDLRVPCGGKILAPSVVSKILERLYRSGRVQKKVLPSGVEKYRVS